MRRHSRSAVGRPRQEAFIACEEQALWSAGCFGAFKVDPDGLQIAYKMVTIQWQDGKRVIVWPGELAPGKPHFPTPPWSQRP